eukprot:CAMPEP_0119407944 /NCGR_PEP_ID=MMETSP1335-20130426/1663_1 /TAXON_ID=259385 /ORGANISM="Chrysoculter rhomboideus, Strain RCC1486" /LENGTH=78 /DNA_ID=CAMNT_0007432113 /DNA_START=68 /DNA_END=300 /DNA_ORIENTATION=+
MHLATAPAGAGEDSADDVAQPLLHVGRRPRRTGGARREAVSARHAADSHGGHRAHLERAELCVRLRRLAPCSEELDAA